MSQRSSSRLSVAVVGYGSQGRAVALNLRDSGFSVTVGLRPGSRSRRAAKRDGIEQVTTVPKAISTADVICMAVPDHVHGELFSSQMATQLRPKQTLWFLAGMSVHFSLITPPEYVDVILLAPHAPGVTVRELYGRPQKVSAFCAVHQDISGRAPQTIRRLARGMGFSTDRLVETTFEAEAIGDLFGEQAVLCGGLAALLKAGFETLVDNGLPADNAYLEVVHQLDLIVDLIKGHGISGMFERISVAAQYGSLVAGPRIIDKSARRRMEKVYREIANGAFVRRISSLSPDEIADLKKALSNLSNPQLEKSARKFR